MADLTDELRCPICLDIFTDPVTLVCGHNFCWKCIDQVLRKKVSGSHMCPQCRKRFRSRPVLTKNINLSNIAEQVRPTEDSSVLCTFCDLVTSATKTCLQCETSMCKRHLQYHDRSVRHDLISCHPTLGDQKCPVHNKIRAYYCPAEAACICLSCCLSPEYGGLRVMPLNEACEKKRRRLKDLHTQLCLKAEETRREKKNIVRNIEKIQRKAEGGALTQDTNTERLLQHLTDHLQELEEDEEHQEGKIFHIDYVSSIPDPIDFLERMAIDTDDGQYSAGDTAAVRRGPPETSTAKKWWFPRQKAADISLNTDTAGNGIQVSQNRITVICSVSNLPEHPETSDRFTHNQILSIEQFDSGRHYWDVETGQPGDWMIGVCYLSMDRKGKRSFLGCNSKSWCLRRRDNEFWLQHNNVCRFLPHVTSCHTVRVSLDYKAGRLSFHDLGSLVRHLHTYRIIFIEPVRAVFTLFNGWLQIRSPP